MCPCYFIFCWFSLTKRHDRVFHLKVAFCEKAVSGTAQHKDLSSAPPSITDRRSWWLWYRSPQAWMGDPQAWTLCLQSADPWKQQWRLGIITCMWRSILSQSCRPLILVVRIWSFIRPGQRVPLLRMASPFTTLILFYWERSCSELRTFHLMLPTPLILAFRTTSSIGSDRFVFDVSQITVPRTSV